MTGKHAHGRDLGHGGAWLLALAVLIAAALVCVLLVS